MGFYRFFHSKIDKIILLIAFLLFVFSFSLLVAVSGISGYLWFSVCWAHVSRKLLDSRQLIDQVLPSVTIDFLFHLLSNFYEERKPNEQTNGHHQQINKPLTRRILDSIGAWMKKKRRGQVFGNCLLVPFFPSFLVQPSVSILFWFLVKEIAVVRITSGRRASL